MPFLVALLAGYLFSPGFPSGGGFSKYFDKPAYLQQATGGLTPDIQHSQAKQLKPVCFCALSVCAALLAESYLGSGAAPNQSLFDSSKRGFPDVTGLSTEWLVFIDVSHTTGRTGPAC